MTKDEILAEALKSREEEVMHYQINIDNYIRALDKASADPQLVEFVAQLNELLSSSIVEQKKAMIIRDVIKDQLDGIS